MQGAGGTTADIATNYVGTIARVKAIAQVEGVEENV